jgi:hypothetical protein
LFYFVFINFVFHRADAAASEAARLKCERSERSAIEPRRSQQLSEVFILFLLILKAP